jgi:hypothetical protein
VAPTVCCIRLLAAVPAKLGATTTSLVALLAKRAEVLKGSLASIDKGNDVIKVQRHAHFDGRTPAAEDAPIAIAFKNAQPKAVRRISPPLRSQRFTQWLDGRSSICERRHANGDRRAHLGLDEPNTGVLPSSKSRAIGVVVVLRRCRFPFVS